MLGHFEAILDNVASNPDIRINELSLLTTGNEKDSELESAHRNDFL